MKRIRSLKALCEAANNRRAVYVKRWRAVMPAVFLCNMQGVLINQQMCGEGVYLYDKNKKQGGK